MGLPRAGKHPGDGAGDTALQTHRNAPGQGNVCTVCVCCVCVCVCVCVCLRISPLGFLLVVWTLNQDTSSLNFSFWHTHAQAFMLTRVYTSHSFFLIFILFLKILFYLTAPGPSHGLGDLWSLLHMQVLSCSMQTLSCGMWDLLPQPGIEPRPHALGAQSLNHWTAREVPTWPILKTIDGRAHRKDMLWNRSSIPQLATDLGPNNRGFETAVPSPIHRIQNEGEAQSGADGSSGFSSLILREAEILPGYHKSLLQEFEK